LDDSIINKKINFLFPLAVIPIPNIDVNTTWIQIGLTVAGGNEQGNELNQLEKPYGIYVYDDETIYVSDESNHRIMEWRIGTMNGRIAAGGNGKGNRDDQLNRPLNVIVDEQTDSLLICDTGNKRIVRWPRQNGTHGETIISKVYCNDIAMDKYGYLYVSDHFAEEVKRWKIGDRNGIVVAGGNGKGDRFDQLNYPTFIIVDQDQTVYVSDNNNYRVMKWTKGGKEGIVVAGGQGKGNNLRQMSNCRGVIVDQAGSVYVVDQDNHRVMRWLKDASEGSVIVGGQSGRGNDRLHAPSDLTFDRQNNLYVVDRCNHRIQKFNISNSVDSKKTTNEEHGFRNGSESKEASSAGKVRRTKEKDETEIELEDNSCAFSEK
jgi:hypothetical protein